MPRFRSTADFYNLFHQGLLALAEVEACGVRVDKVYLDSAIERAKSEILEMEVQIKKDPIYQEWKRAYGDNTKLSSRDQLSKILMEQMGRGQGEMTGGKKRFSTRKNVLEQIDLPFVKQYLKLEPMKRSLGTSLLGIRKEMVQRKDGSWWIHPHFNLNTAQSMRSSANQPNWQAYPKRNKEIAALVRPAFIPLDDWHFGEIDYGQIEVRVPAALTGDEELFRYVTDENSDMHRDQACEVFMLRPDQVTKAVRQTAKGPFVFATFYGSVFYNTAKAIWDEIDRNQLATAKGTPLKKWLAKKGITELGNCDKGHVKRNGTQPGTFVHHMKNVQDKLWKRFRGYADWKQRTVEAYRRNGGLMTVTGFAMTGPYARDQICNYPIQGPAFHCLLWAMIEIMKWIRRYRMKTKILGEIHDSFQFMSPRDEIQDVLTKAREVMTRDLPRHWPWLTVPLVVECDISPPGKSWFDCEEWVEKGGLWAPKRLAV